MCTVELINNNNNNNNTNTLLLIVTVMIKAKKAIIWLCDISNCGYDNKSNGSSKGLELNQFVSNCTKEIFHIYHLHCSMRKHSDY